LQFRNAATNAATKKGDVKVKKSVLKQTICLIIAVVIFATTFAGCGGSKETADKKDSASTVKQEQSPTNADSGDTPNASGELRGLVFPFTTTGETLRIATCDYSAGVSISDELPVFKKISEKTGVKIIWEVVDPGNYGTTMQTRLAAGVDLPDMFKVPTADPTKLIEDGIIIPIDGLMAQHAPNMKYWFDATDDVRRAYTMTDGHIYTIPQQFQTDTAKLACYNNLVLMLREDWLKDLNLEVPKTMDEFYNVLKAFKTKDPNKNNKNDEIPFTCSWSGIGLNLFMPLAWMYGIHPINDGIYPDSSGKLVCEWQEPRMKEFLIEMNKWFKEGLIDPDFMNLNYEKWAAQINGSIAGSTFWFNMAPYMGINEEVKKSSDNPEAGFIQIPTPSASGYEGIIESLTEPYAEHFAISKDCKNPELAIKWLDYVVFSEEGVMYHYFGIEGLSFEYVDGKPVLLDSIKNSPEGEGIAKARIGMDHHGSIPILVTNEALDASWGALYPQVKLRDQLEAQIKKTPRRLNVFPTREESERLQAITNDLVTYRNEMLLKFITGEIPISEFDSYVKKLSEIGMDEVMAIEQSQFDRSMK